MIVEAIDVLLVRIILLRVGSTESGRYAGTAQPRKHVVVHLA